MPRLKYRKPGEPVTCGTWRGWYAHYRRGEKGCLPCCDALAQYEEDRRLAAQRRAVLAEAVGHGSYGGRAGGS